MKMGHKSEEDSPAVKKEKEIVEKLKIIHMEYMNNKRNSNNRKTDGQTMVKRRKLEIHQFEQSSPKKGGPCTITTMGCPILSISKTENISQTSDLSNIATENCSNVTQNSQNVTNSTTLKNVPGSVSQSSDISNFTNEYCSNVTQKSQTSDFSDVTIENCSNVNQNIQNVTTNTNGKSDLSAITIEDCSNVTRKVTIFEDKIKLNNRGVKPKLTTLKVNKIRSPMKRNILSQNKIISYSKSQISNIKNDEKNCYNSSPKSARLSLERQRKQTSSPLGNRWRHRSTPILNKKKIFIGENGTKSTKKINENVGLVEPKKVSPKLGHKQSKLTRYFGERGHKIVPKEVLHENDSGHKKPVQASSVNCSKKSENSALNPKISAVLEVKSDASFPPIKPYAKRSSKVYQIVDTFESNFGQGGLSDNICGDFKQPVEDQKVVKKNVFELLMSGGKTPISSRSKSSRGGKGQQKK